MPERRSQLKPTVTVDLIHDDGNWPELAHLTQLIDRAVAEVAARPALVTGVSDATVVLSSDAAVSALNGQFRGKDKPTNVLSFPAGPGAPAGTLGDIVLAFETVEREAGEEGIAFSDHVQHLVVHGLLHLLGFDHEAADDAERMEQLEIAILADLGIANPYTAALETGIKE
jgi:probable rRNA maturation factor